MVTRQQYWLRCLATSAIITVLLVLTTAQLRLCTGERRPSSPVADIVKGVVLRSNDICARSHQLRCNDARLEHVAAVFPQWLRGAQRAVSPSADGQTIRRSVTRWARTRFSRIRLRHSALAAAQNLSSRLVERALLARYPEHRKMVKTIGWIQRIGLASLMSYHLSAAHYRQAGYNVTRARELGYPADGGIG